MSLTSECVVHWSPQLSDIVHFRPVRDVLLQTVPNILRSTLFLAVNGGGFIHVYLPLTVRGSVNTHTYTHTHTHTLIDIY